MENQKFDINRLRVASPCSVDWANMSGDERVRHCDSCRLNVYNIAGMTSGEVKNLIETSEGRLCIRLYKRADGSVLTKDCPIGFRAYQKRISRFAGATLATILGLFSVSFGQSDKESKIDINTKIIRTENQSQESVLYGTVVDMVGAVVPGAKIKLSKKGEKNVKKITSNAEGEYAFYLLTEGIYELEAESTGFNKFKVKNLEIKPKQKNKLEIVLDSPIQTTLGIFFADSDSPIETDSSTVSTTVTPQQIEKLPR